MRHLFQQIMIRIKCLQQNVRIHSTYPYTNPLKNTRIKSMNILKTVKYNQVKFLSLLCFLAIQISSVSGQNPYFRSIKLPDEIQQTSITCLYQDNNSYMWIGTGKGLYQYDGNDFIYFPGNSRLSSLPISALYMTPDQTLWIGTRKGEIYHLKGDSLRLFDPEEGNPKVSITAFTSDKQGNLWFSTYGEGVYYYDGKHIFNIDTDDGLTDNYCYTITPDKQGRMWVATDGGISLCSLVKGKKHISSLTTSDGLPDDIVQNITANGNLMWVGMEDAGICKVDINSLKITIPDASKKWAYGPVNNIIPGQNWLWLSSERNGVLCINPATGEMKGKYTRTDNANIQHVSQMYADRQGNCWIASGSQLFLSLGQDLLYFTEFDHTTGKNVHSILSDSWGNTWFSNEEGLFILDAKSKKTNKINLPIKTLTHIISLYEDSRGYIWAGTFGSGLFCINPDRKRVRLFGESDGLSNGNILSITGKGNEIWLATLGGAYKCNIEGDPLSGKSKVSFYNYGDQHFPGNNYIYSVFIDSQNRVWFGTDGKGISKLEKGRFVNFDKAQGLKSNIIYSIAEDSNGDIWFSTSNAGIYRYNGKSFRHYTLADGLSDLTITGILADKNHHLLLIHNNGVDILDTHNNTFLYYSANVGMSEINPDLNVCSLEGDNVAWLGTQHGLIRMQIPSDLSQRQPSLQMDMVSVFMGKENYIGTHLFSYDQNHISFHFNALWYIAPTLVKYQIRLKGYDIDWLDTRNNLVAYSNLPPGQYTFEVRSSIKGNFDRAVVKDYTFSIQKPFWKTNLFILAAILCIALLVYMIVRLRENALKKRDAAEHEKIMFQFQTLRSQVNPHFLFNSFSTLISVIDEDKAVAIEYVEKLSKFFRDILDYRDKDLIPLSEELKLIDTYYYLQQKRYCKNLSLEIEVGRKELQSLIPPMVLQMLVENAIKHNVVSAEQPLRVRIFTDEKHIIIINNLQPKKAGIPSTGIGLANIRNRYKLLGFGETAIDTTANEFIVKLPIIYSAK